MTACVVDASVAVEYLLRTPLGMQFAETVEQADPAAPGLLDTEVMSVLRKAVLTQRVPEARALTALEDLAQWPVDRIPNQALARTAWRYIRNITAYDAFYVAAASLLDVPLLTVDGRLARAPGLGITVQHIRLV